MSSSPRCRPRTARLACGLLGFALGGALPAGRVVLGETPAAPQAAAATIERAEQLQQVQTQKLQDDIDQAIRRARELVAANQAEAALETLRLARNSLQASDQVPAEVRDALGRRLDLEYRTTLRREEDIEQNLAEQYRLRAQSAQAERAQLDLANRQERVNALMVQFDALMAQGQYNVLFSGGLYGNINEATAPFFEARSLSMHARALDPRSVAPRAGILVSQSVGFLAQTLAFEELKEFRYMRTLQDVERASVPFPDTTTIEYPPADFFRAISERRIRRYESTDLSEADPKTKQIQNKLEQPYNFPFESDTPLKEVLSFIKTATTDSEFPSGIPIYVDREGVQ